MDQFIIETEEAMGVIFHPYRIKIIKTFTSMPKMIATFKQIADILGDNSSKVTYHGKMLIELGILVLDHTKIINGINAKYYRLKTDIFNLGPKINLPAGHANALKNYVMSDFIKEMEEKIEFALKPENSESISLNIFSGTIMYLTDDEINELHEDMYKYTQMKTPREGTKKVDFYSLLIHPSDKKTKE